MAIPRAIVNFAFLVQDIKTGGVDEENDEEYVFFLALAACGVNAFSKVPASDSPSAHALQLLHKMVDKFHAFLSAPQKLIYKQKSDQSPSKSLYLLREFTTREVSSEMKDTNSTVIPFNAYIQFTLGSVADSAKCGSIELKSPAMQASASSVDALKFADKPDCFTSAAGVALPLVIHVNFAYQHGKWVAKSVTRGDGKREPVFTATLLGTALDDIDVVEDGDGAAFNNGWKTLMTGNS